MTKKKSKKKQCDLCNGSGLIKQKVIVCPSCNGKSCIKCYERRYIQMPYGECIKCFGTGKYFDRRINGIPQLSDIE